MKKLQDSRASICFTSEGNSAQVPIESKNVRGKGRKKNLLQRTSFRTTRPGHLKNKTTPPDYIVRVIHLQFAQVQYTLDYCELFVTRDQGQFVKSRLSIQVRTVENVEIYLVLKFKCTSGKFWKFLTKSQDKLPTLKGLKCLIMLYQVEYSRLTGSTKNCTKFTFFQEFSVYEQVYINFRVRIKESGFKKKKKSDTL